MMKVLAVLTTLCAMRPTDGGVSIVRQKMNIELIVKP